MSDYDYDAAMDQLAEWEEEDRDWSDEQPDVWSVKRVFREEEQEDDMKQDDIEKCLLVRSIPINSDIQNQIASFAFHDNHDSEFQHRKKMKHVFHDIGFSSSRKNGFHGLHENDTNNDEWTFETTIGDVNLQANSCHICGNYTMSNTFYVYPVLHTSHEHTLCLCYHHIENIMDEEEDAIDW